MLHSPSVSDITLLPFESVAICGHGAFNSLTVVLAFFIWNPKDLIQANTLPTETSPA